MLERLLNWSRANPARRGLLNALERVEMIAPHFIREAGPGTLKLLVDHIVDPNRARGWRTAAIMIGSLRPTSEEKQDVVPRLVRVLRKSAHHRSIQAEAAALALGRLVPDGIHAALELMEDPDLWIRYFAVQAIPHPGTAGEFDRDALIARGKGDEHPLVAWQAHLSADPAARSALEALRLLGSVLFREEPDVVTEALIQIRKCSLLEFSEIIEALEKKSRVPETLQEVQSLDLLAESCADPHLILARAENAMMREVTLEIAFYAARAANKALQHIPAADLDVSIATRLAMIIRDAWFKQLHAHRDPSVETPGDFSSTCAAALSRLGNAGAEALVECSRDNRARAYALLELQRINPAGSYSSRAASRASPSREKTKSLVIQMLLERTIDVSRLKEMGLEVPGILAEIAAKGSNEHLKSAAAFVLGDFQVPEHEVESLIPALVARVRKASVASDDGAMHAAQSLGKLGRLGLEAACRLMADMQEHVRGHALWAVWPDPPVDCLDVVEQILLLGMRDVSVPVRARAASLAGPIVGRSALVRRELASALFANVHDVEWQAVLACRRGIIGDGIIEEALVRKATSDSSAVGHEALIILAENGIHLPLVLELARRELQSVGLSWSKSWQVIRAVETAAPKAEAETTDLLALQLASMIADNWLHTLRTEGDIAIYGNGDFSMACSGALSALGEPGRTELHRCMEEPKAAVYVRKVLGQ